MKHLLIICSCVENATNGEAQALRDTFLKDVSKFPDLEYKFFIGDGQPTNEDETALFESFDHDLGARNIALAGLHPKDRRTIYIPKDDEVILKNVPDDFAHLTYKSREACRWALENGFEHTFHIVIDVYVAIDRMMNSGFSNYDYLGNPCPTRPEAYGPYAGGCGYWLSRKALMSVVVQPVTFWAEDLWVGSIMNRHGITLTADNRFHSNWPVVPHRNNSIISTHIGVGCHDVNRIYNAHLDYIGSL